MKSRLFSTGLNSSSVGLKSSESGKETNESGKKVSSRVWSGSPYTMQATYRRKELVTDGNYDDEY